MQSVLLIERNRERAKFKHLEYKFQKKLFDNLIEKVSSFLLETLETIPVNHGFLKYFENSSG